MNVWLFAIPLISAFIGYFLHWAALKMLFHPQNPIRFLGMTFQGIYPKRQQQIGEKLGKLVSDEVQGSGILEEKISHPDNIQKLMPLVEQHIDSFLQNKLPKAFPMLSMFIGEKTIGTLKSAFMEELNELFPQLMQRFAGELKNELNLEKLVEDRINALSSIKLESYLKEQLSGQLQTVRMLGALTGFLVGLIQVAITLIVG